MIAGFQLWTTGAVIAEADQIRPRLASWDRKDHPSQVRLRGYLDGLAAQLGDLPRTGELFLDMVVDVDDPARMVRHYDLENYLTPVVERLGHRRFKHVIGRKCVGRGSSIRVGHAGKLSSEEFGWTGSHLTCPAGAGAQSKAWKERIRTALLGNGRSPMPSGPVEVLAAWRCSSTRNWASLWKPTLDAMGPVLGEADAGRLYNPNDDRIVSLQLHLNSDDSMGHSVDVGLWWRLLA